MTRLFRPHPLLWFDRFVRTWWPFLVCLAAFVVIATMAFVTWTVVDERDYFEAEQARDRRQDEQVSELLEQVGELVERQRTADASRDDRLEDAIDEVEQLLADQFAEHDYNVATKLNDLLAQIAALLGRPAGVAVDPVVAIDGDGSPTPPQREPRERPQPTTTTAPPSTTTTTSPGRSGLCERNPSIPLCRRAP